MELFDHQKTWRFKVVASPDECQRAFVAAMTKRPGLKIRAVKWELRRGTVTSSSGVPMPASIATYTGRAGIAAFTTGAFGTRAESAENVAIGSELTFVIEKDGPVAGVTECSLYLSKAGTVLGLTQDAGFFRSYMADVERSLRGLDPEIHVSKS